MTRWFHSAGGQDHGPFTVEEIKSRAAQGLVKEADWVWPEGSQRSQGTPANAVLDFSRLRPPAALPDWLADVARVEARPPRASPRPALEEAGE